MFVIIPTSGLIKFDNVFISFFLSIPTSNTPKLFFILILKREIGTPNLLLNEFLEHVVDEI